MRFPKWSPSGLRLAYETGNGRIVIQSERSFVEFAGNRPCWLTEETLLHTTNNGATFALGNPQPVYPTELHELAAGGGQWGGVDLARGGEFVLGGVPQGYRAGQPFFDRDGNLIVRKDDSRLEPTCLGALSAWKVIERGFVGVETSWGHRYPGEGYPRLIWTTDGPELLTMTNTGLRIRRVGEADRGYVILTGENRNLEPDAVYRNGAIWIACNSGVLAPVHLNGPRSQFVDPPPPPPPPPPPLPPEPPVSEIIPNHEAYVKRRWDELGIGAKDDALHSAEEREKLHAEFCHRVGRELFEGADGTPKGSVGLLYKPAGTNYRERSTDGLLVAPLVNGLPVPRKHQFVKIIAQTSAAHAFPMWDPKGWNTNPDDFREPFPVEGGPPPPPPPDVPTPPSPTDLSEVLRELAAIKALLKGPFRITVKSDHGYLSIQGDGRIEWDRQDAGPWETLIVEKR